MNQKGLLNVAVVAVVAFAVPQVRGLSLSLFRKLRRLTQPSINALPNDSQAELQAPDQLPEETGDAASLASEEGSDNVAASDPPPDGGEVKSNVEEVACPSLVDISLAPTAVEVPPVEDQITSVGDEDEAGQREASREQIIHSECGPSEAHRQNGEEGDGEPSGAGALEVVGVSAGRAVRQAVPSGRGVYRPRNFSRGAAPLFGAASSAPSAPNHDMAGVRPFWNRRRVVYTEGFSAGGRNDVGINVRSEHGYIGRLQSGRGRGGCRESRRNSTIPLTCARCGLLGHRAMHCNRPFVPIPRHWSYPMRGLAQLLRENAGVPVEWE